MFLKVRDESRFIKLQMKINPKYSNLLFAFIMSVVMALIMSGILTAIFTGFLGDYFGRWLRAFSYAWPIAFPSILLISPVVRRLVTKLTQST
jgi:fructose-specific phosphotransferase system IIC component